MFYIIQPICTPVNDNLMELLIMIDAAKRASAGRVTAVVPYYGYGRTDKKDQPRVPITARLVADLLTAAGADRLLTIDPSRRSKSRASSTIPVDELTALTILSRYFQDKGLENLVVVAVDIGISKRARDMAEKIKRSPRHYREASRRERRPCREPQRNRRCGGQDGSHIRR